MWESRLLSGSVNGLIFVCSTLKENNFMVCKNIMKFIVFVPDQEHSLPLHERHSRSSEVVLGALAPDAMLNPPLMIHNKETNV